MQNVRRHARGMEMLHGAEGGERRLLGGLRYHGIAGSERARELPGENGKREIPGRDAGEHAAPMQG